MDSSRKCNFGSRLKEQAAVAVLVFSNTTYQRTRNELHAAYLRATLSDCYPQESGHFQVEIAKLIGANKSTVSKELRRNHSRRGYRPNQAHRLALERRVNMVITFITPEQWQGRTGDSDAVGHVT